MLKCICSFLNGPVLCNAKLYADLYGFRFDDLPPLTIPSSIVVTSYYRLDLVIVSESKKVLSVLKLMV